MADEELHETDSEDQKDWQTETDADVKDTDTNETDEADDDYGVSMDKVQAVLNATADKSEMTPQMQRMMSRQAENTRRVEETIKPRQRRSGSERRTSSTVSSAGST